MDSRQKYQHNMLNIRINFTTIRIIMFMANKQTNAIAIAIATAIAIAVVTQMLMIMRLNSFLFYSIQSDQTNQTQNEDKRREGNDLFLISLLTRSHCTIVAVHFTPLSFSFFRSLSR